MTDWLSKARDAFQSSTDYLDTNWRSQWEDNINHFRSEHHSGSKYNSEAYKYRSKIFRPKTRSAIRNNEAAAVQAFFSNEDVMACQAQNPTDQAQVISAEIMQELVNYRLEKAIPWFKILVGAFQEAQTNAVCSKQYWQYESRNIKAYDPVMLMGQPLIGEDGQPVMQEVEQKEVIKDKPCVELVPLENIRFHPAADWTDPIGTSPYLIHMIPMYVQDIKARMAQEDEKTGQPKWNKLGDGEIRAAIQNAYDTTRQTREDTEDKYDQAESKPLSDYEVAWVHENFMRENGEDYVFYTLGTEHMLSSPKALEEVYFHGERPFAFGGATVEAFRVLPDSLVKIGQNVQREINEIVNQRLDNVKLVLNKRWIARRQGNVDLKSLLRNVPGAITLADNPAEDVREINWPDVTSSAFQEQDRLNVDFDEAVGTFSGSTIQTNRKMNETVGGMAMLRGSASSLIEYTLRTFAETWVEEVLRQLVKLEQAYETDEVVLAIAADRAKLLQKYGIDQVTDDLLNKELTITVNVGTGSTDPLMKLERFIMGLNTCIGIMAQAPPGLDIEAVVDEVFGKLGYRNSSRFFNFEEGQQMMQMQQMIQQLQAQLEQVQQDKQSQVQGQMAMKQMEQEGKFAIEQMKQQGESQRKGAEIEAGILQKQMDLLNPVAGESAGYR